MADWEALKALWEQEWRPVSKAALIGWLAFYALFILYALTNRTGFLFIDRVNLIVHEAGHLLFSWLGPTLGLWGGTLLELLVPLALAVHFAYHRQTTGVAFALFFFFENFLYISVYMADAPRSGSSPGHRGRPGRSGGARLVPDPLPLGASATRCLDCPGRSNSGLAGDARYGRVAGQAGAKVSGAGGPLNSPAGECGKRL